MMQVTECWEDHRFDAEAAQPPTGAACGDDRESGSSSSSYGEHGCCKSHNKTLGEKGEQAACQYLARRGVDVIQRNWKCKFGEADIVALDDGAIVFIEVKTRSGVEHGLPEDAVTREKRTRYEKIAMAYLERSDYCDRPVRFDAISITLMTNSRAFLRHHKNAFGVGE